MHFTASVISLLAVVSTVAAGDGWCATGYGNKKCSGQTFSACDSTTGCFSVGDAETWSIMFTGLDGYKAHYYDEVNCGGPTWDAGGKVCRTADYTMDGSYSQIKSYRIVKS